MVPVAQVSCLSEPVMSRRITIGIVATLVVAAVAFALWRERRLGEVQSLMSQVYVQRSDTPAPFEAATNFTLSGSLPVSATNFLYVSASVGLGGRCTLYRFEAPYQDCFEHAMKELQTKWKPSEIKTNSIAQPVADMQYVQRAYQVGPMPWFDVLKISKGVEFTIDPTSGQPPVIWIDQDRNILFFYWTD